MSILNHEHGFTGIDLLEYIVFGGLAIEHRESLGNGEGFLHASFWLFSLAVCSLACQGS
jgi:hypothetical protein